MMTDPHKNVRPNTKILILLRQLPDLDKDYPLSLLAARRALFQAQIKRAGSVCPRSLPGDCTLSNS